MLVAKQHLRETSPHKLYLTLYLVLNLNFAIIANIKLMRELIQYKQQICTKEFVALGEVLCLRKTVESHYIY